MHMPEATPASSSYLSSGYTSTTGADSEGGGTFMKSRSDALMGPPPPRAPRSDSSNEASDFTKSVNLTENLGKHPMLSTVRHL